MSTRVYSNWIETSGKNDADVSRHPHELELFLAEHLTIVSSSSTAAGRMGIIHRIKSEDVNLMEFITTFPKLRELGILSLICSALADHLKED